MLHVDLNVHQQIKTYELHNGFYIRRTWHHKRASQKYSPSSFGIDSINPTDAHRAIEKTDNRYDDVNNLDTTAADSVIPSDLRDSTTSIAGGTEEFIRTTSFDK